MTGRPGFQRLACLPDPIIEYSDEVVKYSAGDDIVIKVRAHCVRNFFRVEERGSFGDGVASGHRSVSSSHTEDATPKDPNISRKTGVRERVGLLSFGLQLPDVVCHGMVASE